MLPIRTLILNDCTKIGTNDIVTVIMQLEKLETLSLNRVDISVREAVAIACSQPSLIILGLIGIAPSTHITCPYSLCGLGIN